MSDPRFDPVSASEFNDLVYEVSVLYPPEPIPDLSSLDPQHYGVIVQTTGKRGLLLPGIDGITEVAHQVQIAKQKAGIVPGEMCSYMRFRVIKVGQPT